MLLSPKSVLQYSSLPSFLLENLQPKSCTVMGTLCSNILYGIKMWVHSRSSIWNAWGKGHKDNPCPGRSRIHCISLLASGDASYSSCRPPGLLLCWIGLDKAVSAARGFLWEVVLDMLQPLYKRFHQPDLPPSVLRQGVNASLFFKPPDCIGDFLGGYTCLITKMIHIVEITEFYTCPLEMFYQQFYYYSLVFGNVLPAYKQS